MLTSRKNAKTQKTVVLELCKTQLRPARTGSGICPALRQRRKTCGSWMLKGEMQFDMQSLHHLRDRLVDGRTILIDQRLAILL